MDLIYKQKKPEIVKKQIKKIDSSITKTKTKLPCCGWFPDRTLINIIS
jgi:hypothetical protein